MKMKLVIVGAVGACIIGMASGAANAANLVINGDFETGTFAGWTYVAGSAEVTPESLFLANPGTYGHFTVGDYVVNFNGGGKPNTGVIYQEINTVSGADYNLSFDFGRYGTASDPQSLKVFAVDPNNENILLDVYVTDNTGEANLSNLFSNYNYQFKATDIKTIIAFADAGTTTFGTDGTLDNVVVEPVPVPATMLLFGSGMAGLTGIRFRRKIQ